MNHVVTVTTRDAEAELQSIFKGQWVHAWQVLRALEKKGNSQFVKER